jgi:hypothetical protein
VKKALRWVIIAGLVVWVVQNPANAAHVALTWLSQAGHALTTLTGNL